MRSDFAFLDELAGRLGSDLPPEHAEAAAFAVAARATVQVERKQTDDPEIVQSVLLDSSALGVVAAVTARFVVGSGKPRSVTLAGMDFSLVDLDHDPDILDLVRRVEEWRHDFPMPRDAGSPPPELARWAFAGQPGSGLSGTPGNWGAVIRGLGEAHGVVPDLAVDLSAWKAKSIGDVDFVVAPRSASWVKKAATGDLDLHWFGTAGQTFASAIDDVRLELLRRARLEADVPAGRTLGASEVVYHRKVGTSRKFDHFDGGSSTPCSHGAGSFDPWKKSPKAVKGMARHYSNFEESMLIHCRKYPNCGMYGVDASRG